MSDNVSKSINQFIKSIVEERYSDAKTHLQDAVIEKIKNRIRTCESKFAKKN